MSTHLELLSLGRAAEFSRRTTLPRAGFTHWKRLHADIFSAMPEYKTGMMRQASDEKFEWIKHRSLDNGMVYEVFYALTENPGADADRVLGTFHQSGGLSGLSHDEAAEKLAKLYADLDFCHPFNEGNSRSLRAFLSQLARREGFDLSWEKSNQPPSGRDNFYLARDREVIDRRFPGLDYQKAMDGGQREYDTFFRAKATSEMRQAPSLKSIIAAAIDVE